MNARFLIVFTMFFTVFGTIVSNLSIEDAFLYNIESEIVDSTEMVEYARSLERKLRTEAQIDRLVPCLVEKISRHSSSSPLEETPIAAIGSLTLQGGNGSAGGATGAIGATGATGATGLGATGATGPAGSGGGAPVMGATTMDSVAGLIDGTITYPASSGIVTVQSSLLITGGLTFTSGTLIIYGDLIITGNFIMTIGTNLIVYGDIITNAVEVANAANVAIALGTIVATKNIYFQNFKATNASANTDGVHIQYGAITASNIFFKNNTSNRTTANNAVHIESATITATTNIIVSNNISNNTTFYGVLVDSATMTATNIMFSNNTANTTNAFASGVAVLNSTVTVTNNILFSNNIGNTSNVGSPCNGVFIASPTAITVTNNISFSNNRGLYSGAGVLNQASIRAMIFELVQDCSASKIQNFDNSAGTIYRLYGTSDPLLALIDNTNSCTNNNVPASL